MVDSAAKERKEYVPMQRTYSMITIAGKKEKHTGRGAWVHTQPQKVRHYLFVNNYCLVGRHLPPKAAFPIRERLHSTWPFARIMKGNQGFGEGKPDCDEMTNAEEKVVCKILGLPSYQWSLVCFFLFLLVFSSPLCVGAGYKHHHGWSRYMALRGVDRPESEAATRFL